MSKPINIALFASGSGSNVENIVKYFSTNKHINPCCVLCNNANAYVLERAKYLNLDTLVFNRSDFKDGTKILDFLRKNDVNFIVLAGFLWLVPEYLIDAFPSRVVNIHPALLPKFGGKGMYGMNVHQAVYDNKEVETGITIHLVDKHYDCGTTVFQAKVAVDANDSPEDIAQKVHKLEYEYFPKIIEKIATEKRREELPCL